MKLNPTDPIVAPPRLRRPRRRRRFRHGLDIGGFIAGVLLIAGAAAGWILLVVYVLGRYF